MTHPDRSLDRPALTHDELHALGAAERIAAMRLELDRVRLSREEAHLRLVGAVSEPRRAEHGAGGWIFALLSSTVVAVGLTALLMAPAPQTAAPGFTPEPTAQAQVAAPAAPPEAVLDAPLAPLETEPAPAPDAPAATVGPRPDRPRPTAVEPPAPVSPDAPEGSGRHGQISSDDPFSDWDEDDRDPIGGIG